MFLEVQAVTASLCWMLHSGEVQYAGQTAPCEWKVFVFPVLWMIFFSFIARNKQQLKQSQICKDEITKRRRKPSSLPHYY